MKLIGQIAAITLIFNLNTLGAETVSRHILALYNTELKQTPAKNLIHENAEVILNHLGCIVDYWDISQGFPDNRTMQKYLGVITWFHGAFTKQPIKYWQWVSKQVDANKKLVILGELGDFEQFGVKIEGPECNKYFKRLGFQVGGDWSNEVAYIELIFKDPAMVEFERKLKYELDFYLRIHSINPSNKIYLRIKRTDMPESESDLVFTTPTGGLAISPYVYYQNPRNFKKQWRINPFKFFEEAFGLQNLPRPDVTTLNGSRVWCSHIDGDALISQSEVKPNAICGEVIRDEIIQKYKWPISVSIIVAEVEKSPEFQDVARSIYRIKWVEAASHSYSHPFYWADDYEGAQNYERRHIPIEGYTFNTRTEIIGSVKFINQRLLPPDKKVKDFFWTGNCEPTLEALKYCREMKLNNFNGGDTVFDQAFYSYSNVTPLGVKVGSFRQIYSPNSNENVYTNEWDGPYYGFKLVLNTFQNTESPVRIKPINIYFHFYSGEKWAALNALKEVMDKTIVQNVAPMFVSNYIDMVKGYYSTRIDKVVQNRWKIKNYGKCTTIRFDHTQKFPDLERSKSVLGFLHYQNSLYVHLKNTNKAEIVLTNTKPEITYLKQASHRIVQWRANEKQVSFKSNGFGAGYFVIANLQKSTKYNLNILDLESNSQDGSQQIVARTDAHGTLAFHHPMEGAIEVNVSSGQ